LFRAPELYFAPALLAFPLAVVAVVAFVVFVFFVSFVPLFLFAMLSFQVLGFRN
jgi:hypothetical protein